MKGIITVGAGMAHTEGLASKLAAMSSAQAPVETREASPLVGSDAVVGGSGRKRGVRSPLMLAMLGAAMIGGGMSPAGYDVLSRKPLEKTPEDLARIAAAKAKQERKRLRKEAAKTAAPNIPNHQRAASAEPSPSNDRTK